MYIVNTAKLPQKAYFTDKQIDTVKITGYTLPKDI